MVGDEAFSGCESLEYVGIPSSLKYLGKGLFSECKSLEEIIIPESVETISNGLVGFESGIKRIKVSPDNPFFKDIDGVLYSKDGKTLFTFPAMYNQIDYVVPQGTEQISNCAFQGSNYLRSITLPTSITTIGVDAFAFCEKLQKVDIPHGVTKIKEYTFLGCEKLKYVSIPDSVKEINHGAFRDCVKLKSIHLPSSVVKIADDWRHGTGSDTPNFENIFIHPENTAFKVVDGVVFSKDGKLLLSYTKAGGEKIVIPDGTECISNYAFCNAESLESVILPQSLTAIGKEAFYGCSKLKEIIIPPKVVSIGEEAFRSCEALKEIVIPSQIQSIRTRALGLPNRGFLSITFVDYGDTQCRIAIHGIDIPENLKEIKTDKANRVLQQSLITKKSIPVAWCSYIQEANAEECANVLLYQSMKAWKVWLSAYEKNAGEILMNAVMLVQDVNKISSSSATR